MEAKFYQDIQNEVLVPILNSRKERRGELTALANRLEKRFGMAHAKNRLAELRAGRRKLSFFYLSILIQGGVMTIEQILRGRKMTDLNAAERDIVQRLDLDTETLALMEEAKSGGIDVKAFLKILLKK